jgi:hypothetical protein
LNFTTKFATFREKLYEINCNRLLEVAIEIFSAKTDVQISSDGRKYLAGYIGSEHGKRSMFSLLWIIGIVHSVY